MSTAWAMRTPTTVAPPAGTARRENRPARLPARQASLVPAFDRRQLVATISGSSGVWPRLGTKPRLLGNLP